jgi:hypothetical protein
VKVSGPHERRQEIARLSEIFEDVLADITLEAGEPKIVTAEAVRETRWSAVWFIGAENNGFSLKREGGFLTVKTWSDAVTSTTTVTDIEQVEMYLRKTLSPKLLPQISEKEAIEQELRGFLSRAVRSYLLYRTHPDIQHKPGSPAFYRQEGEDAGLIAAQKIIEEERPSP